MSHVTRERPARRCGGLIRSDDGTAAIEYALLGALIAGAVVVTVWRLGSSLNGTFTGVGSAMNVAQSGPSGSGGAGPNGNGNGNGKGGNGKGGNGKGGNGKGNNGNGKGNGGPKGSPVL